MHPIHSMMICTHSQTRIPWTRFAAACSTLTTYVWRGCGCRASSSLKNIVRRWDRHSDVSHTHASKDFFCFFFAHHCTSPFCFHRLDDSLRAFRDVRSRPLTVYACVRARAGPMQAYGSVFKTRHRHSGSNDCHFSSATLSGLRGALLQWHIVLFARADTTTTQSVQARSRASDRAHVTLTCTLVIHFHRTFKKSVHSLIASIQW
jgi:hypothetical protein